MTREERWRPSLILRHPVREASLLQLIAAPFSKSHQGEDWAIQLPDAQQQLDFGQGLRAIHRLDLACCRSDEDTKVSLQGRPYQTASSVQRLRHSAGSTAEVTWAV